MSALPGTPPCRKTFALYLATFREGDMRDWIIREGYPDHNFAKRLKASADHFDSLTKIQTWARLRWPDWYTCQSGKHCMARLWALYLAWAEADES